MANFFTKYLPSISFRAKQPSSTIPANYNSGYAISNWFSSLSKSGETVNKKTAFTLSTYYASIRNIAEDISKLPYVVVKNEQNGNRTLVKNINAGILLSKKPNNYSTPIALKYAIISDGLISGNGYAYIERDSKGLPIELHYIESSYVYPEYDIDTKRMYYRINYIPLNLKGVYSSDEIFHFKGPGNTMVGQSMLAFQLDTLGRALSVQGYSSEYFKNGASMSGLLSFEGVSDEKKIDLYLDMFLRSFKKGGVGAMPSGVKFEAMNNDPQKSQLIETENHLRGEIARWFRMPLSKLQDQSQSNNNSLEQDNINYTTDCLLPWIIRFQEEADQKLFAVYEREMFDGYFDLDMLLRGDSAAMERKIRTMFTSGAITPNEVRRMYGENSITDDYANITYVPSNMITGTQSIEFWQGQAMKNNQLTNSQPGQGGVQQ